MLRPPLGGGGQSWQRPWMVTYADDQAVRQFLKCIKLKIAVASICN
jgi:hypothetical protein